MSGDVHSDGAHGVDGQLTHVTIRLASGAMYFEGAAARITTGAAWLADHGQQAGEQQADCAAGFTARRKAAMNLPAICGPTVSGSRPAALRNSLASSTRYTRVGSTSTDANPLRASFSRYSFSSSAPAMQPTQSSMLLRISAGRSPRTSTSDIAKRPPGLSTRNASARTRSLSPERLMTQLEMIPSTELSGRGTFSIAPLRNSTFSTPAFF